MLKGGQVKKYGVAISFLQPIDSRSLFPEKLFLSYDVVQIRQDDLFLLAIMVIVSCNLDIILDRRELIGYLIFLLENMAKDSSIPSFDVSFHIFQLLGNSVHCSAFNLNAPPMGYITFQRRVREPHFLKAERGGLVTGEGGS